MDNYQEKLEVFYTGREVLDLLTDLETEISETIARGLRDSKSEDF